MADTADFINNSNINHKGNNLQVNNNNNNNNKNNNNKNNKNKIKKGAVQPSAPLSREERAAFLYVRNPPKRRKKKKSQKTTKTECPSPLKEVPQMEECTLDSSISTELLELSSGSDSSLPLPSPPIVLPDKEEEKEEEELVEPHVMALRKEEEEDGRDDRSSLLGTPLIDEAMPLPLSPPPLPSTPRPTLLGWGRWLLAAAKRVVAWVCALWRRA